MSERPRAGARYYKAHGLGNDYLVFEEGDAWSVDREGARRVCDRWRGVGGDGIVVLLRDRGDGVARLRMFNPDGGEFERSGNGLRILASFLAREGRASGGPFTAHVGGDAVTLEVHARHGAVFDVSVGMGRARVGPGHVGLDSAARDDEGRMRGPDGARVEVTPVWVGNPHLVVWAEAPPARLERLGPHFATHPALAAGANVQLAASLDPGVCRALIWERGVGKTSASGTSACAVAVAAVHRGVQPAGEIRVGMEGGDLRVTVTSELDVVLRGPVEEVCEGTLAEGFIQELAGGGGR